MSNLEKILIGSGIVSEEQLAHDYNAAEFFGILPGLMLVGSRHISDDALLTCSKLDSLAADDKITMEQAIEAARLMYQENKTWNRALLTVAGTIPAPHDPKLGELLVAAGLITELQAASAMITANKCGLVLGQALLRTRLLNEDMVVLALRLQACIRDHRMPLKLAITQLQARHSQVHVGTFKRRTQVQAA